MSDDIEERLVELEAARKKFGQLVQSFERDFGANSYLNRAPNLSASVIAETRLLPTRYELLDLLPKGGAVIEVGVDLGLFSRRIVDVASPRELILIDIDLSRLKPEILDWLKGKPEVRFVEGDSATVLAEVAKNHFDWIYVDAHHGYDFVSRDIANARDKVKVGGLLVFNDYTLWSPANMMNYGVSRAVNELLNESSDWVVDYFALQGANYYDIALRRVA